MYPVAPGICVQVRRATFGSTRLPPVKVGPRSTQGLVFTAVNPWDGGVMADTLDGNGCAVVGRPLAGDGVPTGDDAVPGDVAVPAGTALPGGGPVAIVAGGGPGVVVAGFDGGFVAVAPGVVVVTGFVGVTVAVPVAGGLAGVGAAVPAPATGGVGIACATSAGGGAGAGDPCANCHEQDAVPCEPAGCIRPTDPVTGGELDPDAARLVGAAATSITGKDHSKASAAIVPGGCGVPSIVNC